MRAYEYSYKTIPYMTFYVAGFPTADPNVPHRMKELRTDKMTQGNRQKSSGAIDEAIDIFGETYDIFVRSYDMSKIAKTFDLEENIKVKNKTNITTIFTDGKKTVAIDNAMLDKLYTNVHTEEKKIYRLEEIEKEVGSAYLYRYLTDSFQSERKLNFEKGSLLQLSLNQIKEVQRYIPNINLFDIYNCEYGGNIFVRWTDQMWFTYP